MTKTNNLGPILATIRHEKNLKSAVIARHIGVSLATYSQIETGHRTVSFERIELICMELGITLENLIAIYQQESLLTGGEPTCNHR